MPVYIKTYLTSSVNISVGWDLYPTPRYMTHFISMHILEYIRSTEYYYLTIICPMSCHTGRQLEAQLDIAATANPACFASLPLTRARMVHEFKKHIFKQEASISHLIFSFNL